MQHTSSNKPNHLINEKSPYLQQHAYNPVEWYPWGEEAFDRARLEGKSIFLSIGYSTCHWCHVMERESFEDEATAALMNELFINIKVDREERPDIDQVYMTAAQAVTGSGGWPLSVWLTPDLHPFYVGTYFPPRPAYGRPSFGNALRSLNEAWQNDREKVVGSAEAIARAIRQHSVIASDGSESVDHHLADLCFEQLGRSYDSRYGGFSGAPKFPRPAIFEFLLRYHYQYNNPHALEMTLHTLRQMARGGMYDQLGGGFARYSVDAEWRVHHFEKMLYDQGQLLACYADAYRLTGDPELERVMHHTVEYLRRDLMHANGAFYSAEDADSEGEEGTFYVWTRQQLQEVLTPKEFEVIENYYGITQDGNFEHGKNVLHTSASIDDVAHRWDIPTRSVNELLGLAREKLFAVRQARIRPSRDEKILVSWNGLMISGLARAAAALNEPRYADLARRAANYISARMNVNGRLMHRMKDDEVRFTGYLEDYAFFAQGLIDLYETTFDLEYLKEADQLVRLANELFYDEQGGGYFMTTGEDTSVMVRSKSDHDGAEPSGNSVMALNLLRLGRLFDDETLVSRAERTIGLFASRVAHHPLMMPLMIAALMSHQHPPRQVIIAASPDSLDTQRLLRQVHAQYLPDTALVLVDAEGADPWLVERIESVGGMHAINGRAAAYVCENLVCRPPVTEFGLEDIPSAKQL